jgi:hypothetical protein
METTPISQTLYRFVSLRNPELTNDEGKDKRFVFRDAAIATGIFDDAVKNRAAGVSKWQALQTAAASFTAIATEAEVKALNTPLYDFSVWLARNKSTMTEDALLQKTATLATLANDQLRSLWNNLFYQVAMQKSFYVKEAIMQLLVANHVVRKQVVAKSATSAGENEIVANAQVVLPQELFVEEVASATNNNNPARLPANGEAVAAPANSFMQKQQAILTAQANLASLKQLKTELLNAEKKYRKDYYAAFENYKRSYDEVVTERMQKIAPAPMGANNLPAAGIEEENPPVRYPIDPVMLPADMTSLPPFEFRFEDELDAKRLTGALSKNALNSLTGLLGVRNEGLPVSNPPAGESGVEVESFGEALRLLGDKVAENETVIINNTSPGTTSLSVGGVLIPESPLSYLEPFEYQLCPKPLNTGNFNFDLSFEVPDASWEVSSMIYHLRYKSGGTNTNGYLVKSRTGSTILLANLYNQGFPFSDSANFESLQGEILFTNGQKKTFNIKGINFVQCFTGILAGGTGAGNGSGNNNPGNGNFIPKGFGFKQIGIADYKKVEQTVHCYVEGEVAHIENIMAREYKEKATRKLRRNEVTTTTSSESEREQLSDTTSTSRFDMQSEVAKVIQQSRDFSANASVTASWGPVSISAGANYATHTSKDESTKQAVTQAKEITARALDRIVTKVNEERIEKVLEEFEENNLHGFDNKKGDKHVVGVYRWVDKVYKNRIHNYGKRLMLEFMVPEPAKLHLLGMKSDPTISSLRIPEDPRTASVFSIKDASQVSETNAKYWAGKLNAEISAMPDARITIGKSFAGAKADANELFSESVELEIPEGYKTVHANIKAYANYDQDNRQLHSFSVSVGKLMHSLNEQRYMVNFERDTEATPWLQVGEYYNKIPISYHSENYHAFNITITVKADLTAEAKTRWQQETFNSIIRAYEVAMTEYEERKAQEEAKGNQIKGENPQFYRQIEQTILRKNCISYMVDQRLNAKKTYGQLMHNNATVFSDYEVNATQTLDEYTGFAKFLEQAFEWEIMSYFFYPFYWASKQDWQKLYQTENMDPVFRSFLQSGLARVVVTVRPGFEAAVQHYLSTGQVWNGGQVPVIGDPLFLSIADELRQPLGNPEGKAWATRVPTPLTILQANSIGLKVEKALPCECDDLSDFENPAEVPCGSSFELTTAKMEAPAQQQRLVENIDINNGDLQLTDDGDPRKVIAAISLEAIKKGMGI